MMDVLTLSPRSSRSSISRAEFDAAWLDVSLTRDQVAERLGVAKSTVHRIAKAFGVPTRRSGGLPPPPNDPTPDEIAEMCLQIQAGWSAERFERASRW